MEDEEIKKVSYKKLSLFFVVVIVLWSLSWIYTTNFIDSTNKGTFGDMFGAVNALFSGLAFAGVIFAILLQRQELEYQRQELKDTRRELKGQREALELQNFNDAFFQLVRFQHDITNSIETVDWQHENKPLKGRDCFEFFFRSYRLLYIASNSNDDDITRIKKTFLSFFETRQSYLAHYFRNLYNIYRLINNSSFKEKEKKFYSNIIRGQLSNYELLMLFYNGLSKYGENFIKYIVAYELFDNMPLHKIINKDHLNLYDKKAYGSQLENESSTK